MVENPEFAGDVENDTMDKSDNRQNIKEEEDKDKVFENSPMSLSKPKRKHKPTQAYEIFQKQQLHSKRYKKQMEKT